MDAIEANLPPRDVTGRGRIVREARTLFTAQGYAAVSMQQIADAASVNKATLYHHFRDKEDLFVSVMEDEFRRMTASVGAAIAEGGSLRDQLTRVAAYIFSSSQSDFGRLAADLHEQVSEQRRSEMMARRPPPWEQIREAVERAMLAGEVRDIDADLVARLFFAMVRSQVWWSRFATGYAEPDDQLAATISNVLLDGIATETARGWPLVDDRVEEPEPART
ncbi:MAG: TetR/AcrR family transcriptional regulator [Thermomicrobiales bacterium]